MMHKEPKLCDEARVNTAQNQESFDGNIYSSFLQMLIGKMSFAPSVNYYLLTALQSIGCKIPK